MIKPYTNTMPKSFEEGLQRVCEDSKFGFLIAQTTFRGLAHKVSCEIVEISRSYYASTISFIINEESPYKRLFTRL